MGGVDLLDLMDPGARLERVCSATIGAILKAAHNSLVPWRTELVRRPVVVPLNGDPKVSLVSLVGGTDFTCDPEHEFEDGSRIDFLLTRGVHSVGLENKTMAKVHGDQLDRYRSHLGVPHDALLFVSPFALEEYSDNDRKQIRRACTHTLSLQAIRDAGEGLAGELAELCFRHLGRLIEHRNRLSFWAPKGLLPAKPEVCGCWLRDLWWALEGADSGAPYRIQKPCPDYDDGFETGTMRRWLCLYRKSGTWRLEAYVGQVHKGVPFPIAEGLHGRTIEALRQSNSFDAIQQWWRDALSE